jgi:ATP-dependent DNA ligase
LPNRIIAIQFHTSAFLNSFLAKCQHAEETAKFSKSAPLRRDTEPPLVSRPVRVRRPEQPEIPFDPMPAKIEPCLAQLVTKPPVGDDWVFEIKRDGYRMAVHVEPSCVRVFSRNGSGDSLEASRTNSGLNRIDQ